MAVWESLAAGITRVQAGDVEELAAWRRDVGLSWDPSRNAWLAANPVHGEAGPGPWVCRRAGRIVGQQGEIPFELQVGRERRRAVWAIGLHVEPAWRRTGAGPALIARLLESNAIVCVLNVSADGYPAFTRSGCVDLGIMPVYRRPLAGRALRLPRLPTGLRRLAPVLAPLLGAADGLAAAATRLAGARLVPVPRLDERVGEVWAAAAPAYPVLACRDPAALAWRIDQRPDRDRLRRYYLVRRGRPVGYVVLRPSSSAGQPTVVVVDYLAPPRWVAPLLLAAGRAARRDGAVALNLKTRNVPADRALRLAGFARGFQGSDHPIQLLVACRDGNDDNDNGSDDGDRGRAGIGPRLRNPDAWFLTAADSDIEYAVPS